MVKGKFRKIMHKQEWTITIYTENNIGILNRIATMFSRRRINIESLNVAASEVEGIHRFTIVIYEIKDVITKLSLQIQKQVEVLKSFYHTNEEVVWQEQALYKVIGGKEKHTETEKLAQKYGARQVPTETGEYTVFETTGSADATENFLKILEPLGLTEFVKSARIAIIKSTDVIHQRLKQFDTISKEI